MSFRFKLTDFVNPGSYAILDAITAVDTANRLLNAHLATLPEVYTDKGHDGLRAEGWYEHLPFHIRDRCAKLWGIEEIKPKYTQDQCPHLGIEYDPRERPTTTGKCMSCGKRLVAKWEEA